MSDVAVLLLAHGTPGALEEIPEYLRNVTGGRPLPQSVIAEITHRYSLIGKSPLTEITARQADALARALQVPVYFAMRNWKPYIADVVRQMHAEGIRKAAVICLAPQNSRTSVGLYRRAVEAAAGDDMSLEFVSDWAEHSSLIAAFARKLQQARENFPGAALLFTAHSVPCRTVWHSVALEQNAAPQQPDPYAQQAKRTAERVAESVATQNWYFAFQSQGASGGPWLGPSVEETLAALAREDKHRVLLQPIGFLCDHVEILYDIDIAFQQLAEKLGVELRRPESLNDSPELIAALASIASSALERLGA